MKFDCLVQRILKEDFSSSNFSVLYHATPSFLLPQILKEGLKPRAENKLNTHKPAVYLVSGDIDAWNMAFQLNKALKQKSKKLTDFAILQINTSSLNPNTVFYKDPFSIREAGILTHDPIPASSLSLLEEIPASTFLSKNWFKAKNKRFYS